MKTQSHLASSLPVRITSDHPGHDAVRTFCIQESQGFSVDLLGSLSPHSGGSCFVSFQTSEPISSICGLREGEGRPHINLPGDAECVMCFNEMNFEL